MAFLQIWPKLTPMVGGFTSADIRTEACYPPRGEHGFTYELLFQLKIVFALDFARDDENPVSDIIAQDLGARA